MKDALKLYYRYMPKWLLIYNVAREFVGSGGSVFASVILPSAIAGCFTNKISYGMLLLILVINLLLILLSVMPDYFLWSIVLPRKELRMTHEIQKSIFAKMHSVSMRHYDQQDFFEKFHLAMTNAPDAVQSSASWLNRFIGMFVKISTTTAVVAIIDAKIFLLMGGCLILGVIFEIIGASTNLKLKQRSAYIENVFQYCERVFYLENYSVELRTSNIGKRILTLLQKNTQQAIGVLKGIYKKLFPVSCFYSIVPDVIMYFGILTYICYGIVVKQTLSVGELVALLMGTLSLYQTSSMFTASFSEIINCSGKFKFYRDFMNMEDETEQGCKNEIKFEREICFQDISMAFENRSIINHLSLNIEKGKTVAIVGPNGAGKSTLLKLLLKYYEPTGGQIRVDGIDITEMDSSGYRELFAYVNQSPVVFEMSVAENIMMKSCVTKDDRDKVWAILEKVGLKEKVETLHNTIDSVIGTEFSENGVQLSGGQLQRLVVARALATDRPIIILDEPSSHLDSKAEYDIFEAIKKEGKTIIFITHNIKNTEEADHIIWMENGNIAESGTFDELIRLEGKYYNTYHNLYNSLLEESV